MNRCDPGRETSMALRNPHSSDGTGWLGKP
jgi:hypothetical protein